MILYANRKYCNLYCNIYLTAVLFCPNPKKTLIQQTIYLHIQQKKSTRTLSDGSLQCTAYSKHLYIAAKILDKKGEKETNTVADIET